MLLTVGGPTIWWAWWQPCPVDPVLGRSCMRLRRASVRLYMASVGMFLLGAVFTFVLPRIG
jgi:Sec-independent protein secretion pathway component TatC